MVSQSWRPRALSPHALCALFAAAFLIAPAARAADANADLGRYADQLFSKAYPAGEPGAAVLIVKDGQIVLRKAYGLANLELGVPMRPGMVFEIASVTKQFTAAAILLLQERGKLSVDDDITKYLPDYPTHGRKITIDHLLHHLSGIPEVTGLPEWWPRRRDDLTILEVIDLFKNKPLDFNPGEKQSYSNSGYILLGAILEKASGKTYEDFVEQEIFAPLGMKRSRYGHRDEVVPDGASGYDVGADGTKVAEYISLTQPYAAGGLLSTVDDLALWAEALSSEKLLKRASLERMTTPARLASGDPTTYAYGQGILNENGVRIIEHSGGLPGFNAELLRSPDQRLVVIILSNIFGHEPALPDLAFRITMKALGKAVEERKAVDLDPATLDDYTGTYRFDETTSRTIFREGKTLFARRTDGDKHEILAASRDDFFYHPEESASRIHFRRDAQGKIIGMEFLQTFGPGAVGVKTPRLTETGALAAVIARADDLTKQDQFSGALLIARHGKVLLRKAWGSANRETGAPVTLDTQFRVGSMNKMFTAVATLQLVEAGKLGLDTPIGKYLTDYPNQDLAAKVTVRHLLTHTGGTGDIFGPDFVKNRLTLREHGDYLKLYGSRALIHEPGKDFHYSNYGFVLLGAIIEKVSGMTYYDYVDTRIFKPAGMTSTASLPENADVPLRAVGYTNGQAGWEANTGTLPWRGTSAGGGYSTVGDFLRFVEALESGKLISKATFAEATQRQKDDYGYGFQVNGDGRSGSYGHGGGAPGINGDLRVFPQLGYVMVALSNLDPPAASRLVDFIAAMMPE
jgi:CubicO group peptidase (beta-lactamase class C family)